MLAELSVTPDINPETHLKRTTQQLRRKVEMIFFRYTQLEVQFDEVLPDHVLGAFLNYTDAFAAVHPEMPSLDSVALNLEKDSQQSARNAEDEQAQLIPVSSMLEPLSVKGTYIPFRLYRSVHPKRLSHDNVEMLKATFYPDLVTNRLASRPVRKYNKDGDVVESLKYSGITYNQLIACNVLFSCGRSNLINSSLHTATDEVDHEEELTTARFWLWDRWQQIADSKGVDDDQRAIAKEFVALHEAALAAQGIDVTVQPEEPPSASLIELDEVGK